jgi:hypothetical protein
MAEWTNVSVTPVGGQQSLLENGTGHGGESVFACSKFGKDSRPVKNQKYDIVATPENEHFPMDWTATCTFSGETSEFKVL